MSSKYFRSVNEEVVEYPTSLFLTAVAQVIREGGFKKDTCKTDALALVIQNRDYALKFQDVDFETANNALAWLFQKENHSNFERDLVAAVQGEAISYHKLGLVVYLIKGYLEVKDVKGGEFIAPIGGKVLVDVGVISSDASHSEWGLAFLTKAVTKESNVVSWYAKEQKAPGDLLKITGKVKAHRVMSGVNVTYLYYVKEI